MSGEDIGRKWRGSGEEVEIEWGIEWGRERVSIEDGRLEGVRWTADLKGLGGRPT